MVTRKDNEHNQAQALWAARRGMLELDLVLQPFISKYYNNMSSKSKQLCMELLKFEDQELYSWLILQDSLPGSSRLQDLVLLIRFTIVKDKAQQAAVV